MSVTPNDPDAIERDLHATRSRLGREISELTSRLSPGEMLNEALGFLKTEQGVDFSRNLARNIRERPIPAALLGIGLAWLMVSPRDERSASPRQSGPYPIGGEDLMTRAWNVGRAVPRTP